MTPLAAPPVRTPLPSEVEAALARGATVVTPTRRLARDLRRRYDEAKLASGARVWPAADALPWPAWLQRTWEAVVAGDDAPRVLSELEIAALWQRAVEADHLALLEPAAAARLGREAQRLAADWHLSPERDPHPHEDVRAFLRWRAFVEAGCRRLGGVDPAYLPAEIGRRLTRPEARLPAEVVAYGFDAPAPAMEALLDALAAAGSHVRWKPLAVLPGAGSVAVFSDAGAELEGVAAAVGRCLEADPGARVGVVVPGLHSRREAVRHAFTQALDPQRLLAPAGGGAPAFEISLGEPLSKAPLVATALAALRLGCLGNIALPEAGALLRSPYLGEAESESVARALLDARLRERGALRVDLAALRFEGRSPDGAPRGCAALLRRLDVWQPVAEVAREARQLPSAWSVAFQQQLGALGWPGQRPLDSAEFQAAERWRALVAGLSPLDGVLGRVDFATALSWLARIAAETVFQPETGQAPVQVLGLLEAAGLAFDHLFVTGATDDALPALPAPHPLLPLSLQRAAAVPRCDAAWETGFAARTVAALQAAAPRVCFSWSARDGEREQRLSPLLRALPGMDMPPPSPAPAVRLRPAGRVEETVDERAPPLAGGTSAAGGARLLEDQSACPFRAFASHRLEARALAEAGPGLTAADRGRLLHEALALLWRGLGSQAALLEASPQARDSRVAAAVDAALAGFSSSGRLTPALRELEAARLGGLIGALLEREALRAPFVVEACEANRRIVIGELAIEARLDRVDVLADGRRVVIDYKSAKARAKHWDGERPDQPQLPLYAVTQDGEVAALVFAVLSPGEVGFTGAGDGAGLLPGVEDWSGSGWAAVLEHWKKVLASLAREFRDGHAAVAPQYGRRTCEHCHLGPLCRVAEIPGESDGHEDGHEDGDASH